MASVKRSKTEKGDSKVVLYNCDNCDSLDSLDMQNCYKPRQGGGGNYFELKNYFAGYPPVTLESLHLANLEDKSMVFNQSLSVN